MDSSELDNRLRPPLIADASVVINLFACSDLSLIVEALPGPLVAVQEVVRELRNGTKTGHEHSARLDALAEASLLTIVTLSDAALQMYESLVNGRASATLDDGEAASIAWAVGQGGTVLIDDRKGIRVCAELAPELPTATTTDLLLSNAVTHALGVDRQRMAVLQALQLARMFVPPRHQDAVRRLIGEDVAMDCPSLPRSPRGHSSPRRGIRH